VRTIAIRFWRAGYGLYPKHLGVPKTNIPTVAKIARSLTSRKHYLDIGGGHSQYSQALTTLFESFYCLDIVIRDNPMTTIAGDAHALPIKSGCIDFITAFEVLEHLEKPWVAFEEIARVLNKGGLFAVTAPMYWHVHGWPRDYWRFTADGLKLLAENAGLAPVLVRPMGGPAILCSMVAVNTFGLNKDPFRRVLGVLLTWACYLLDRTIFRAPERMQNPDTRGWLFVASKP